MRPLLALLPLCVAAAAQPPAIKDFVRMRKFRENISARITTLVQDEEYAQKPREEKMLLTLEKGERTFEGKALTAEAVVETCLLKWADVQEATPTEAGKRVLTRLPEVMGKRYAGVLDVDKRDRYDASAKLIKALDSESLPVRNAAFDALKKIYRTSTGFMYEPTMTRKEREKPIKEWDRYVKRQKQK
jgi:hypothetical protein